MEYAKLEKILADFYKIDDEYLDTSLFTDYDFQALSRLKIIPFRILRNHFDISLIVRTLQIDFLKSKTFWDSFNILLLNLENKNKFFLFYVMTDVNSLNSKYHIEDLKKLRDCNPEIARYAMALAVSRDSLNSSYHEFDMETILKAKNDEEAEILLTLLDHPLIISSKNHINVVQYILNNLNSSNIYQLIDEMIEKEEAKNMMENIKINSNNKNSLGEFYEFYQHCLLQNFDFDALGPYRDFVDKLSKEDYNIIVLKRNNNIVGGAIYEYLKQQNTYLIHYLASCEKEKEEIIFEKVQELISDEAKDYGIDEPNIMIKEHSAQPSVIAPEIVHVDEYFLKKLVLPNLGVKVLTKKNSQK